jgi:hypothetical protein
VAIVSDFWFLLLIGLSPALGALIVWVLAEVFS